MNAIPIAFPTAIIVFNRPEAAPASSIFACESIALIKGISINPFPTASANMNGSNCDHCNPVLTS